MIQRRTDLIHTAEQCGMAAHEIEWILNKWPLRRWFSKITNAVQNGAVRVLRNSLRKGGAPVWNGIVLDMERPEFEPILRESLALIEEHTQICKTRIRDHVAVIGIGDYFTFNKEVYAKAINIGPHAIAAGAPHIAGTILRRYATRRILSGRTPLTLREEVKARCGGYRYERHFLERLKSA